MIKNIFWRRRLSWRAPIGGDHLPYSPDHKNKTRARIVEAARLLFNRHGFDCVSIDMIMQEAGLTRGGFYSHFKSKEALYSAAVASFLMGRGAQWRADAGVDPNRGEASMAVQMIEGYLSAAHLGDRDGQCPMIALPSDIARSNPEVRQAYQHLLESMVWLFESNLQDATPEGRQRALSLAALCIGGMVIARTLPDSAMAGDIRAAAFSAAMQLVDGASEAADCANFRT
ncbi:TetR/AcrR family transcriptional regulator [Lysobacter sp. D1-1-M9]|uniref:TetR/AcrR family transcriptional regulator n=1 Tax=Novilysobacter longmucuonensis TaxID=3098603 RepID=UPI002FCB2A22